MPARPWHRGALGRRPGNGPFGTLDRSPKSQIVIIGEPRHWPEIQKDFEAPQIACPFSRGPTPPSVNPPRRDGCSGGVCRCPPLCPPVPVLRRPPAIRPGSLWPPSPGCGCPSYLFPSPPPSSLRQDPLLGPSLCHRRKTPTRGTRSAILPCLPRLSPFNMLFLADPTARGSAFNLNARNPNKIFKCTFFGVLYSLTGVWG